MKLIKVANSKTKLKISKKEWKNIGKKAGWTSTPSFGPELEGTIGEEGLCPVCGKKVKIIELTKDGRLIGSCKDAFPLRKWRGEDHKNQSLTRNQMIRILDELNLREEDQYTILDAVPQWTIEGLYSSCNNFGGAKLVNEVKSTAKALMFDKE